MAEHVVLLHGFGGTHRAWDGVIAHLSPERYRPLALDLPGHGQAGDWPRPITLEACAARVLDAAPPRFLLCGYSLGGRVALTLALAAPERVAALVLVSAGAGIEDAGERARRRAADERLAAQLQAGSFADFIARWNAQPLFATDPPAVLAAAERDLRRNHPQALAAVLRGAGAGQMQPLWGRLAELRVPALALAGERDERYRQLAARIAALAPAGRVAVLPGGHRLALESPRELAQALEGLHAQAGAGG